MLPNFIYDINWYYSLPLVHMDSFRDWMYDQDFPTRRIYRLELTDEGASAICHCYLESPDLIPVRWGEHGHTALGIKRIYPIKSLPPLAPPQLTNVMIG